MKTGAGAHIITGVDEIPKEITAANQGYLQRALIGSDNRPQKVFAYVLTADGEMGEALQYFSTQNVDYLCPPPEGEEADVTALIDWVKKQREDQRIYKAVVANQAADCEGVINFTTAGIQAGEQTYTAAQYVSRIAGILVGGAVKGSCTYKPLLEVADFTRLANKAAEDAAADKGELILLHDGRKAKLGRGVNSLTTTGADKGGMLKKIKIVETKDRITYDLRLAVEDHYIGKYNNDYSDKLTLLSSISAYLQEMEEAGYLKAGTSLAAIDMDAQRAYLKKQGVAVDSMTEQQIKEADTDTFVFVLVKCRAGDHQGCYLCGYEKGRCRGMRTLTSAKRVMNGSKGKLYLDGEYVAGVVSSSAKVAWTKETVYLDGTIMEDQKTISGKGTGSLEMEKISSFMLTKVGERCAAAGTSGLPCAVNSTTRTHTVRNGWKLRTSSFDEVDIANWSKGKKVTGTYPFTFSDWTLIDVVEETE